MEFYNKQEKFSDYYSRDIILNNIGYSSYAEYLKSDLWISIRDSILDSFPKCFICNNKSVQVHHKSYSKEVLLGIDKNQLIQLCRYHHKKIEFDLDSSFRKHKNSLEQTNKKLSRLHKYGDNKAGNSPLEELLYGPGLFRSQCYKCNEHRICYDYTYLEYTASICSECKKDIENKLSKFKEKKYKILTIKNWLST